MSVPGFAPANRLEQALRDAAVDPAAIGRFQATLADEQVLVPLAAPAQGDHVELRIVTLDGVAHVPVFTSQAQVEQAGRAHDELMRLSGRDLAAMWPSGIAMAINPGGGLGFSMPAQDVEALTAPANGGAGGARIPAGSELIVGQPAEEPIALIERLRAAAVRLPAVVAMHRALFKVKGSPQPPRLVIGVELTDDSSETAPASLAELAEAARHDAALLELKPGADDPVSVWMRQRNEPFYRSAQQG